MEISELKKLSGRELIELECASCGSHQTVIIGKTKKCNECGSVFVV